MANFEGSSPSKSSQGNQSELDHLAHRIATISAQAIIESCCAGEPVGRPDWWNISRVPYEAERGDVALAVAYLDLRGLLQRHPYESHLVRCQAAAGGGQR